MKLKNSNNLVIESSGFIRSHVVSELLKTNISKVLIFYNLTRAKLEHSTANCCFQCNINIFL